MPIDPFPDIIVYNTAKLKGPIKHNVLLRPVLQHERVVLHRRHLLTLDPAQTCN